MKPSLITFTGADDMTPIEDLLRFVDEAKGPVEMAILFSDTRAGSARYPSMDWIREVREAGIPLAAHICGAWSKALVTDGACPVDGELKGFARVQINTARTVDPAMIRAWADRVGDLAGHEIEPIVQCRDVFPEDDRVSWLFDCSGGKGVLPDSWPQPPQSPSVRFGFAGGLGPDNLAEALRAMPQRNEAWIDMETKLRNAEDRFDLDICRNVCHIAWGEGPEPSGM